MCEKPIRIAPTTPILGLMQYMFDTTINIILEHGINSNKLYKMRELNKNMRKLKINK